MKKRLGKLILHRETLATLQDGGLRGVQGGSDLCSDWCHSGRWVECMFTDGITECYPCPATYTCVTHLC